LYISGTGGFDVDAAAWGPFTTPTGNCNNLGAPVSCDYSSSSTATISIPNAVAGQYYQVLITNFSNQPQNINFVQNNASSPGAGSTNC
ncbi:hypothetical protein NK983_30585, partial [Salmonella enterica subsp. enterica serovar Typhimurium]|nr:hypothetical protein [Salmonella enterica subsp. enterica serovar Typhimurium]